MRESKREGDGGERGRVYCSGGARKGFSISANSKQRRVKSQSVGARLERSRLKGGGGVERRRTF